MSNGEKRGKPIFDVKNVDGHIYRNRERLIEEFFKTFNKINITRQDLMWWCQNVDTDSINDPTLIGYFPNFSVRKEVINLLLKPVSFFKFLISKEAADKAVNISFAICEVLILVLIFRPNLSAPPGLLQMLLVVIHLVIGLTLSFFVSFSISLIAFWSAEIWAPRFIYFILVFSFLPSTYHFLFKVFGQLNSKAASRPK